MPEKPSAEAPSAGRSLDQKLASGFSAGGVGLWYWDLVTGTLQWSETMERLHGLKAGSFDGTYAGFQARIYVEDQAAAFRIIEAALEKGERYRIEYRLPDGDGAAPMRWLEARGEAIRPNGSVVAMAGTCQDISERKQNELELAERATRQEVVTRLGLLALREGPVQSFLDTIAIEVCKVLHVEYCKILELMGDGKELLLRAGHGWHEGLVGKVRLSADRGSQAGYTLKVEKSVVVEDLATEKRFASPKFLSDHGVVSGVSVIIAGEDDRAYGTISVHTGHRRRFQQTEVDFLQAVANIAALAIQRAHATERQRLLLRELRHRVGNLLTLIVSLFNNTARTTGSVEELSDKFLARVMSLSRAHTHISYSGWSTASLARLVREVVEPFLDRITLEGPDIHLGADSAFALSLALHELLTNAARHGALSSPAGGLRLAWSLAGEGEEAALHIDWTETGFEPGTPGAARFGGRLVKTVIEDQLGGTVASHYLPDGVTIEIRMPLLRLDK
ncbi:MAG: PAS domain-containing protein [Bauldia sp.]|nr:PAS domain-containing protein [Bauldia sp.]